MSGGVEWGLHCCVVLSGSGEPVPAAKLAEFHDVSPSYLAKQLQLLSRAGLVRSTQGQSGGYGLTRPPAEITVLDVVEAIDGSRPAFRCTEVRRRGPLAAPPEKCLTPCSIARVMDAADRAWRESLRAVTIADLAGEVGRTSGPETLARARAWLQT
ncbi:Rrf2 family transcriptional regulator [Paractinoplanes ferrugineus]|uniref:Transcriptional regulator n=1 Tax=Paractinoplanes ferrugineus TaxID=113564 RepID=A0A919MKN5_9ACTN|nr:Rrf2 family transcriptional regulator [Actinoplanes ferrugineus]GIE15960.1 transcriptional regulator [Actinoplanes ferrugineus]